VWMIQVDLTPVRLLGLSKAFQVVLLREKEVHGPAWGFGALRRDHAMARGLSFQPMQQCKSASEVPVSRRCTQRLLGPIVNTRGRGRSIQLPRRLLTLPI
jgi:hypothetical protein